MDEKKFPERQSYLNKGLSTLEISRMMIILLENTVCGQEALKLDAVICDSVTPLLPPGER